MNTIRKSIGFLLLIVVALTACKKDNSVAIPQPQIVNQADNFSFQVNYANPVTQTLQYNWSNSGVKAGITQSTNLQGGTVVLKIYDASNAEVYSNSIDNNGSFVTGTGTPGTWKIKVIMTNYSGSINFTVQKGI